MANNRKPFKVSEKIKDKVNKVDELSLINMPREITQYIGSFIEDKKDKATYARLSKTVNNFFQADLDRFGLMQSVIDDDRKTVKRILDKKPELLIEEPKRDQEIESQKTWQRFHAKKPLQMAIERNQLEMVKLMLPYFEKLEEAKVIKDGKAEAVKQWSVREISKEEKAQYALKTEALIDVIAKENFPNGTDQDRVIDRISKGTKAALDEFRKELLPEDAITLDKYPDVEEFLIACYKAYVDHFNVLQNWDQRDLYCIAVLGFMQSVLTPELGKVYCEGLYDVVEHNKQISKRAEGLKLDDYKTSFYRSGRDSHSGLGFDFLVGRFAEFGLAALGYEPTGVSNGDLLEKLCQAKTIEFDGLKRELESGRWPRPEPKKQSFCMIL